MTHSVVKTESFDPPVPEWVVIEGIDEFGYIWSDGVRRVFRAMPPKKPRRVRMALCNVCGSHSRVKPHRLADGFALQTCEVCFSCVPLESLHTWLEAPAAA